ncbi:hypothetical protein JD969_07560 [Planctomycetota bacterium]|nr:hypothetical protein JD969_07560 [Planctomycetota bacterium]
MYGTKIKTQHEYDESIEIHCPLCKTNNVDGYPFVYVEKVKWLIVVTIGGKQTPFVKCSKCNGKMISKMSIDELPAYTADELAPFLIRENGFAGGVLAIFALALSFLPIVGLLPVLASLAINYNRSGWQRVVTLIAIAIQFVYFMMMIGVQITAPNS